MLEYGAPTPVFNATFANDMITINVVVAKDNYNTILYRLDTTNANQYVCLVDSDVTVPSAGSYWTYTDSKCTRTYTLVQNLYEIYNYSSMNNNWMISLPSGTSIMQQLQLYVTYSVISVSSSQFADNSIPCQTVTYSGIVTLMTYLTANSSTEFSAFDKYATFGILDMSINSDQIFEIQGVLTRAYPNVTFYNVSLTRDGSLDVTYNGTTNCLYTTGNNSCSLDYTKSWAQLNNGSLYIGGAYNLTFQMYEGNNYVRSLFISFNLEYTVPQNPTIIQGDTYTSTIALGQYTPYS